MFKYNLQVKQWNQPKYGSTDARASSQTCICINTTTHSLKKTTNQSEKKKTEYMSNQVAFHLYLLFVFYCSIIFSQYPFRNLYCMQEYNIKYQHNSKGQHMPLCKVFGTATLTDNFIKMIHIVGLEVFVFQLFVSWTYLKCLPYFHLQLNPDVNVFQRKFVNEVRRCEEMDRKLSK